MSKDTSYMASTHAAKQKDVGLAWCYICFFLQPYWKIKKIIPGSPIKLSQISSFQGLVQLSSSGHRVQLQLAITIIEQLQLNSLPRG